MLSTMFLTKKGVFYENSPSHTQDERPMVVLKGGLKLGIIFCLGSWFEMDRLPKTYLALRGKFCVFGSY